MVEPIGRSFTWSLTFFLVMLLLFLIVGLAYGGKLGRGGKLVIRHHTIVLLGGFLSWILGGILDLHSDAQWCAWFDEHGVQTTAQMIAKKDGWEGETGGSPSTITYTFEIDAVKYERAVPNQTLYKAFEAK